VACGDKNALPDWFAIDVSLAVENMVLTATGEDLSVCVVRSFNEKKVKEAIEIPENYEVILLLAVGDAREKINLPNNVLHLMRKRKTLSEVTCEETL